MIQVCLLLIAWTPALRSSLMGIMMMSAPISAMSFSALTPKLVTSSVFIISMPRIMMMSTPIERILAVW